MAHPFVPSTDHERYIWTQTEPLLEESEQAQAAAYFDTLQGGHGSGIAGGVANFIDAATATGLHALLTDRRILWIKCRIGAFGALMENNGVSHTALSDVKALSFDRSWWKKKRKRMHLYVGSEHSLLNCRGKDKSLPTQSRFFELLAAHTGH